VRAARALRPRFITRYQPRWVAVVVALVAAVAAVATAAVALAVAATEAVALVVAATEDLDRDPADRQAPVVRVDQGRVDLVIRADRGGLVDRVTRVGPVVLTGLVVRVTQEVRVGLVTRVGLAGPVVLTGRVDLDTLVDPVDITATTEATGTAPRPTTPTSTTTITTTTTATGAGSARGATIFAAASGVPRGATDPHPGVRARRRHRTGTNHFPRLVDSGPTAQSTIGDSTKRPRGTHSSTSGASTSSESGSRCRGTTLTREIARIL
jgi:hypothetical protein